MKSSKPDKTSMEDWLERYPPPAIDERRDATGFSLQERSELRRMKPERSIDLHGLLRAEALNRTEIFLRNSYKSGMRKVLIIHGKGLHSSVEPVLRKEIRNLLERLPFTGEFGYPKRELGGTGATWVILRDNPQKRRGG